MVSQNTLQIHGLILWHILVTTDSFIINTGHDWRLYRHLSTIIWTSSEYTKNTRSCTITYTWSPLTTLQAIPVTTDDSIGVLTQLCEHPQNTLKIHGRVLWHIPVTTDDFTSNTGHDRRLYRRPNTIMWTSSEYTKNTRSCTITYTGHYRRLYRRLTQLLGLRSTDVGIWYDDHGRALPTVRIIDPSSPMVSVWPNTMVQSIPE